MKQKITLALCTYSACTAVMLAVVLYFTGCATTQAAFDKACDAVVQGNESYVTVAEVLDAAGLLDDPKVAQSMLDVGNGLVFGYEMCVEER